MFRLGEFTDDAREAALRPKTTVLAGSSGQLALPGRPTTIRWRRYWGALQGLVDDLQNASDVTLELASHVERLRLAGDEVESAYQRHRLSYSVVAEDHGAFVLSACARHRMAEDAFLATLLPALKPLYDQRFRARQDFEDRARALLEPLLPRQAPPAGETDPAPDRALRAVALVVRQASTWVRAYRVRRAVDRIYYPDRADVDVAPTGSREDLAALEAATFNPGEVVREWTYYDYAGPRPLGSATDGPRIVFHQSSLDDDGVSDSTKTEPAMLCRAARSQVDQFERVFDVLAAATQADAAASGAPPLAFLDDLRGPLAAMREAIGDWLLSPKVQRLPIRPDEKPVESAPIALRLESSRTGEIEPALRAERLKPAPTWSVHFLTDRPLPADMTLAEAAIPLRQILQDAAELDAVTAQIDQLDLEALDALAIEVHGYTDRSGGEAHNRALSERRAQWLLDRIRARCRGHWQVDAAALAALEMAGADACALEDLAALDDRRYPYQRSLTRAALEAVVGAAAAARLYPSFERSAVRPVFAHFEPVVGHGEAAASGPDDNPRERRADAQVFAYAAVG